MYITSHKQRDEKTASQTLRDFAPKLTTPDEMILLMEQAEGHYERAKGREAASAAGSTGLQKEVENDLLEKAAVASEKMKGMANKASSSKQAREDFKRAMALTLFGDAGGADTAAKAAKLESDDGLNYGIKYMSQINPKAVQAQA